MGFLLFKIISGYIVWLFKILLMVNFFVDLLRNKFFEFLVELCDFVMIEKVDLYYNVIWGVLEL